MPAWFVEQSATVPIDLQHAETDTGVAQIDSLRIDEARPRDKPPPFTRTSTRAWTAKQSPAPAAGHARRRRYPSARVCRRRPGGVPSVVIGNFTWDWIYAAYPHFDTLAPGVVATIGAAYARTTRALRLPLHGGFDTMRTVIQDVPFIARQSRRGRDERAGCSV